MGITRLQQTAKSLLVPTGMLHLTSMQNLKDLADLMSTWDCFPMTKLNLGIVDMLQFGKKMMLKTMSIRVMTSDTLDVNNNSSRNKELTFPKPTSTTLRIKNVTSTMKSATQM